MGRDTHKSQHYTAITKLAQKKKLRITISKTMCRVKEVTFKTVRVVWSLYEMLGEAGLIYTDSTSVIAQAWGYWLRRDTREYFEVMEFFYILIIMVVTWVQSFVKTHGITHLNRYNVLYVKYTSVNLISKHCCTLFPEEIFFHPKKIFIECLLCSSSLLKFYIINKTDKDPWTRGSYILARGKKNKQQIGKNKSIVRLNASK